ncbi:OTU domain-containing protein DDB_G0284757-like isoform X1 [Cucurbita moschata]|uniref:ubiquitinyl hydrolase 1 n=2 Tax=Cucurbita moschata TaxID=3662 RepID=A0A6J1G0V1_CUCMO|nr:OTU domain-containing protein DDB_G0284757-like isoform X1 [Cucurbita moschata]
MIFSLLISVISIHWGYSLGQSDVGVPKAYRVLFRVMETYDVDPDVMRWGLHLLDVCTFTNDSSRNTVTEYRFDPSYSQVAYVNEGYCEPCTVNLENDEAIAHAFQEEISRIDSIELSGVSDSGEDRLQASVLAQDWLGPSSRHDPFGLEGDQKTTLGNDIKVGETDDLRGNEVEKMGNLSSYHHNTVDNPFADECSSYSLEIMDESSLDGEVGKRLNQIVPVPHVPKTIEKIPSADEEMSDHQRLLERLQLYELIENKIQGDGNCQFRALSDQLYRSPEHHDVVREQIIAQLKFYREIYEGYVPMAYDEYLKKMSKKGEWGDHVTLQAAADWFGVKIFVITSFKDTCSIEILPKVQKSKRIIFLSFWAEVHYNSIYPEGEIPTSFAKKKKKWWNF